MAMLSICSTDALPGQVSNMAEGGIGISDFQIAVLAFLLYFSSCCIEDV